jgi:hypothetical protein
MSDWNLKQLRILKKTSFMEIGLIASRDVQAALDYEKRLLDFKRNQEGLQDFGGAKPL